MLRKFLSALVLLAIFAGAAFSQVGLPWPGPGRASGGPRCAATSYTTTGVVFDGTNDKLNRGAAFTGEASTKTGTFSFWVKMVGADGSNFEFFNNNPAGNIRFHRDTSNHMRFVGRNAASTNILILQSTSTVTISDGWVSVLASWDLAAGVSKLYINNVDVSNALTTTNDTIDYGAATEWWFAADAIGGISLNAEVSDFWFSPLYVDFTVSGNRAAFVAAGTSGVCPVNLGSTGQTPTGTTPLVFFKGTNTTYGQPNLGSGGGMTLTGALTNSATAPSD